MEIRFQIPDEIAEQVAPKGTDPGRIALEAFALEGYRADILSESDLRRILGFESRLDVHAFLKKHGVYLQYDLADLERDEAAAKKIVSAFEAERATGKARQG